MALPLKWMPAYSHGGPFKTGRPIGVAVHCTESDNTPAMGEALAGPNWFGGAKAGTSAHKVVDVDSICEGVKRTTVAYHAGPSGNTYYIAYEFCGRASWPAAKWREPAQLQMLRNAAPHIADDLRACGATARWLSVVQVARLEHGMCTHNDIRLAFPGTTTHSDPGPNFPYAELLQMVQAELAGTPTQEDDMYGANERNEVVGRLDRALGLLESIHPAIASMHVGLMDPTSGVRTVVFQLAGRDPVRVDATELAQTLAPLLAPALAEKAGMTREDVEGVFRSVLGGLNDATSA